SFQNDPFPWIIKKHAKLSENLGPDMPRHSLPCRRSLLEKVRGRPLHNDFPDLQLRQPNLTRPLLASNSLTRASLPRVDFRFQAGSLHKIMRQTKRSITTGVDFKLARDRRLVREQDRRGDNRRAAPKLQRHDLAIA